MHKGNKTLIKFLLLELHTLGLLRNMALYTCQSSVHVSATPSTIFKVMVGNLHMVSIHIEHVHKGHRTLLELLLVE